MPYQYFNSTVLKIIDESDVVKRYFFKVADEIQFAFKAGQFVMLDLPIRTKISNRSYSIASPPIGNNIFELCVVLKPGGLGTEYMWHNFNVGTQVKVSQPLGKFLLPQNLDTDLCFVCTGTGIAPLRSQLLDIVNKKIPHKNIYMIFGNRWVKDILYRKEMEEMAMRIPDFKFIPVLSRDNPEWNGRKGYVHPVYEEIFSDHRPALFHICGWKVMLSEARQRLAAMGYEKRFIRFESFD
jgi:CDP-4-dehydro-6-deoxyglucose reductase